MNGSFSATLRRACEMLAPLRARTRAAMRALDVLERDLLPRTAGGDAYLVAGIVGPNNAGKSALFNALVGRELSPSVPAGGATRRLVGASHPDLLARLRKEPALARFRLRLLDKGAASFDEATRPADDPAELLVAPEPCLPPALMLIDTPDFDSILDDNRLASESLLAVADLVVAVVTRHSYQNREVVRFLERWFDHGRPWMLVYNEASTHDVALAHAAKLADDVGTPPLAVFWAPHSTEVQKHAAALDPLRLPLDGLGEAGDAMTFHRLRDLLFDMDTIAEVKTRAFTAALARLRDDLQAVAAGLAADAERSRELLAAAEHWAFDAGMAVSSAAMPAKPFVDAFRTVLDRRTNPVSRGWRAMVRRLRLGLERVPALFRRRPAQLHNTNEAVTLAAIEREELRKIWPRFWEELVRDLGREARHDARRACDETVAAVLDADLAEPRRGEAQHRAEEQLATQPADVRAFSDACEKLVEDAFEDRGRDWDVQMATDIATLLPLLLAGGIIAFTGGPGSDVAVAAGGGVSTYLMEKYAHVLDLGVVSAARRRWAELRAEQLARVLTDAALPETARRLRASAECDAVLAGELRVLRASLREHA